MSVKMRKLIAKQMRLEITILMLILTFYPSNTILRLVQILVVVLILRRMRMLILTLPVVSIVMLTQLLRPIASYNIGANTDRNSTTDIILISKLIISLIRNYMNINTENE